MPASETLKRLDFRYNDTPRAQTRDGIEIYYESRGEGPAGVGVDRDDGHLGARPETLLRAVHGRV